MLEEMYEYPGAIAWRNFQDEVMAHDFQLKLTDQVFDIYENGVVIYSLDKTTVKYNKRKYSQHELVSSDRVELLESIIYHYCGWGGEGSTKLLEPEKKRKEWTLRNSNYPKLFKEVEK